MVDTVSAKAPTHPQINQGLFWFSVMSLQGKLELGIHFTVRHALGSLAPAPLPLRPPADAAAPAANSPVPTHSLAPLVTPAHLQVTALAVTAFCWRGFKFSQQFEHGNQWDGYAPGLQPGALFGRRVVSTSACVALFSPI